MAGCWGSGEHSRFGSSAVISGILLSGFGWLLVLVQPWYLVEPFFFARIKCGWELYLLVIGFRTCKY